MAAALDTPPSFRTDDLALAATLHCEDHVIVSVEAVGRKAFFIFTWSDDLDQCVQDYHDGQMEVEPRRFAQATGHCRKKMYDALGRSRPAAR